MIFKNSVVLAIFAAISLGFGLVRDRLLAHYVGVGPMLDVYNASFKIPDFLWGTMLAFVTAGTVVPYLSKDAHVEHHDPRKKLSSISLFYVFVMGMVALVLAITAPLYKDLIVPGFTPEQQDMFVTASRILLLQPIFLGLSSLISCFAQLKNEFVMYGISPLAYSGSVIVGLIFFYEQYGFNSLIYSVIVGAFLSLCVQALSLRNANMHQVFLHFNIKHIKGLFHLAYPRTGTNVATQLGGMALTAFATMMPAGTLSAYLFAQKVGDAAVQVVQQSLTTASLPVLSKIFEEGKYTAHRHMVKKYVTLLGFFGLFMSLAVYAFKDPIVLLFFGDTGKNDLIIFFLTAFLLVLPFRMMSSYMAVSLYSMQNTKVVFVANVLGHICSVAAVALLLKLGYISLFAGIVLWPIVMFVVLRIFYSSRHSHLVENI